MSEDRPELPPGAAATIVRPAHFPGRPPIDAYGNGGFRFADMSHRGSILCLPGGVRNWDAGTPNEIDLASLSRLVEEKDAVEVLLVGTGMDLVPLSSDLRASLRDLGISSDAMGTGAAVRTYNVLLSEGRAVAAALLAI